MATMSSAVTLDFTSLLPSVSSPAKCPTDIQIISNTPKASKSTKDDKDEPFPTSEYIK